MGFVFTFTLWGSCRWGIYIAVLHPNLRVVAVTLQITLFYQKVRMLAAGLLNHDQGVKNIIVRSADVFFSEGEERRVRYHHRGH